MDLRNDEVTSKLRTKLFLIKKNNEYAVYVLLEIQGIFGNKA